VSLPVVLGLALVGGVGAVARVVVTAAVSAREGHRLPWGTLTVNLSGSLALGVLAAAGIAGTAWDLAATGFLGAYTTFSTWMAETDRLGAEAHRGRAAVYLALSLAAGLGAVALGRTLGS
jgi:CrcB protein